MSMQLLQAINGNQRGAFHRYLTGLRTPPRLAWYPSAGTDFRDLLYLNPDFAAHTPATQAEPAAPELFIHTDHFPNDNSTFLDDRLVLDDGRTSIRVTTIEELPPLNLPLDPGLVDNTTGSRATGRAIYLELDIHSKQLGDIRRSVLYLFVENAAFLAKLALPNAAILSHVVQVRYGGGCGGGSKGTGVWLRDVLAAVGCEVFITDGCDHRQDGDRHVFKAFSELAAARRPSTLTPIRTLPGASWSDHGDVTWNLVAP